MFRRLGSGILTNLGRVRFRQLAVVVLVLAAIGMRLWSDPRGWPFNSKPPSLSPAVGNASIWQYLLGDPITLGFVRLAVVVVALFLITSIPALVVAGRWLRGIGTSGVTMDEQLAEETATEVPALRKQLAEVIAERDELGRLAANIEKQVGELEKAMREGGTPPVQSKKSG